MNNQNPYNQYPVRTPAQPFASNTKICPISTPRNIIAKIGVGLMAILMIVAIFIPAIDSPLIGYGAIASLFGADKSQAPLDVDSHSIADIVAGSVSSISGNDILAEIEAESQSGQSYSSYSSSTETVYESYKREIKSQIKSYQSYKLSEPLRAAEYDQKIQELQQRLEVIDNNAAIKTFASNSVSMGSTQAAIILILFIVCALGMIFAVVFILLPYKKSLRISAIISAFLSCGSATAIFFIIYSAFCNSLYIGTDSYLNTFISAVLSTARNSGISIPDYLYSLNAGGIIFLIASVLLLVFSAFGVRYTAVPATANSFVNPYPPAVPTPPVPPVQPPFPNPVNNPVVPQQPVQPPVYQQPPQQDTVPLNTPNPGGAETTVLKQPGESQTLPQVGMIQGVKGEYTGASIKFLPQERIIIGRNPDVANIVINSPSVSRKHCEIIYDALNNCYKVINYSTNGVIVNHKNKLPKDQKVKINKNTEISIGNEDNVFRLG